MQQADGADVNLSALADPPKAGDQSGRHRNLSKHPCSLCQQRKVKCDRNEPCSNCRKSGVRCVAAGPPRQRKKRFPEAELLARLRRYEDAMRKAGMDIEAINRQAGDAADHGSGAVKQDASTGPMPSQHHSLSIRRSLRKIDNNLWASVSEEFRDAEEILQGSSEDEMSENPISKTYDNLEGSDFLFGSQGPRSVTDSHPSPIHIFRLWQTFLDRVNPLLKIFHAPTVQQQILDASSNLAETPKPLEALMFSIYSFAIFSMDEHECRSIFDEEQTVLLQRYQTAAIHALNNAGFLRSSDIVVLQALVLYLGSRVFLVDPRSIFCLTGIAIRIGQRMGLNVDGTAYALPPFDVEMRRRLWWQIVILDNRAAEISGAGRNMLTQDWTTNLPLNVNDSDLFPDMKEPPKEIQALTEMVFVLTKCEVTSFIQKSRNFLISGSKSTGDITTAIDNLETRLESKYIRHCDPLVPLHFLTAKTTRLSVCKIRMMIHRPKALLIDTSKLTSQERDASLTLALDGLELHNEILGAKSCRPFLWSVFSNFPFPSFVFTLCSLRFRPNDPLCDRAWEIMAESARQRELRPPHTHGHGKKSESLISLAVANLIVKAWEKRVESLSQFQNLGPPPKFVSQQRHLLQTRKTQSSIGSENSPATPASDSSSKMQSHHVVEPSSASINFAFDSSQFSGLMNPNDYPIAWPPWTDMVSAGTQIYDQMQDGNFGF